MLRAILVLSLLSVAVLASAPGEAKDKPKDEAKASKAMALDELLVGRVTRLKGDVIELYYDFEDEKQMNDWAGVKVFRVAGDLELNYESRGVKLNGSGCFVHLIEFVDEVSIEFDVTPWFPRDFGGVVAETGQSDHFVLFSVNDLHFQKFDGGTDPGHMICRFGIIDPSEPEGTHPFRYVARGKEPEIQKFKKIRLACKKDGKSDEFMIGDRKYQGKEPGREMLDLLAGAYVARSGALIDNVKIKGKISPRWLKKQNVELRLTAPPKPLKVSAADRAAREKMAAFEKKELDAIDMFEVLEDSSVSEDIREEVADAIAATGNAKLVPTIVSLLYSDDEVTRKLANDVIKELAGKSFGFIAGDDEEKRSKAIQKILKHIKKYPKRFQ